MERIRKNYAHEILLRMRMCVHGTGTHLHCMNKFFLMVTRENLPLRKIPAIRYTYLGVDVAHIEVGSERVSSIKGPLAQVLVLIHLEGFGVHWLGRNLRRIQWELTFGLLPMTLLPDFLTPDNWRWWVEGREGRREGGREGGREGEGEKREGLQAHVSYTCTWIIPF